MKKLSLLAIFLVVSCSSIPKTTISNHNIQLTCEVGTFIYYFNLQDEPPKSHPIYRLISENAWYIKSKNANPDLTQESSLAFGKDKLDKKYLLVKPYAVTEDSLFFTTLAGQWEVNRYNLKLLLTSPFPNDRDYLTGTCEYGFQTEQFK